MAFVAHAQPHAHSEFGVMDDNMEISSDAGHRNAGDDDDIDIDIDIAPDRTDENTNDDYMIENTHHNPDDDLMLDENTGQEESHLENMEQDTAGDQYEQLEDVQEQYAQQNPAPQPTFDLAQNNPAFEQSGRSSLTPKPSAFGYVPTPEQNQFYPQQYDHSQPSDNHFQGHPPQFQYPPQELGHYPSDATPGPRPPMTNNLEASNVGYDQSGDYLHQTAHEGPDQTNGYGLSTAAEQPAQETLENDDPSQFQQEEHDNAVQDHDESQGVSTLHPVVINWKGDHFSLFPGHDEDPYDGYFLEDTKAAFHEVATLMDSLRQVLAEDCPTTAELRLAFPVLGLTITQNSSSNSSVSLADIIDVYYSLCLNDGIDYPDPLEAILSTRQDPEIRITELRQAIDAGKGLSHVEAETWNAEDSDDSFDDSAGYADPSANENGAENVDELDEYKEVYEDISAVVKELKTLAPEVELPPEILDAQASTSSDNEEADGEQAESHVLPDPGESNQDQEQIVEEQEHEDLLDETVDEPVEQVKGDKPIDVPTDNQHEQSGDNTKKGGKSEVSTAASFEKSQPSERVEETKTTVPTNNDSLGNLDTLEDPNENNETSHEANYIDEYLETQDDQDQKGDSIIENDHDQEGHDLLEDNEDFEPDHNEAQELLDNHEDENTLEEQEFDTALESTDYGHDQIDDLEDNPDITGTTSATDEITDAFVNTEGISDQTSVLSSKRPREELGSDEAEIDPDGNETKRRRSG